MSKTARILGLVCTALTCCAALAAATPIKVGVLLPSSGVYAGLGNDQTLALELGFDDFGRAVAGREIELVYADSAAKPSTGSPGSRGWCCATASTWWSASFPPRWPARCATSSTMPRCRW